MLSNDPPGSDEIEVTIFGKGVGEAIVAHIPDLGWVFVDSFLHNAEPISLTYLKRIGVSLDEVRCILLTHWHDDHVRGASLALEQCTNASLAISQAYRSDEFRAMIRASQGLGTSNFTSGVTELVRCLSILSGRGSVPKYCVPNRNIVLSTTGNGVETLSPSDRDIHDFLLEVGKIDQALVSRLPAPNRNDSSVACLVKVGSSLILLGADLETKSKGSGWHEVCESGWHHQGQAILCKAPHHGSPNAYYLPLWEKHIERSAPVVIAPYARGKRKLPQGADIARIKRLQPDVTLAADVTLRATQHPNRDVANLMLRAGVKIYSRQTTIGVARFRMPKGQQIWDRELEGLARAA